MTNMTLKSLMVSLLAAQATGCIIYDDNGGGGGGGGGGDARITAAWSFKNQATNTTTACPSGFNTVALHSFPIDASGNRAGADVIDLFDCADGIGSTGALFPDVYQTFLEVTNASGASLYAQSLSAVVDVIDTDKTFTATILNDGGYFQLSWDLVGSVSKNTLDCAQVPGLSAVEAISTSVVTSTHAVTDQFTCEDHIGVTGGLLQGSYTVSVAALAGTKSVGTAPALANKAIASRNQVNDLGHIVIPIDGK